MRFGISLLVEPALRARVGPQLRRATRCKCAFSHTVASMAPTLRIGRGRESGVAKKKATGWVQQVAHMAHFPVWPRVPRLAGALLAGRATRLPR